VETGAAEKRPVPRGSTLADQMDAMSQLEPPVGHSHSANISASVRGVLDKLDAAA
jgi:hypothetical protein